MLLLVKTETASICLWLRRIELMNCKQIIFYISTTYKRNFNTKVRQTLLQVNKKTLFSFVRSTIILKKKSVISVLPSWTDLIVSFLLPTKQSSRALTTNKNDFHATALLYLLSFIKPLDIWNIRDEIGIQKTHSRFILHSTQRVNDIQFVVCLIYRNIPNLRLQDRSSDTPAHSPWLNAPPNQLTSMGSLRRGREVQSLSIYQLSQENCFWAPND